MKTSSALALAFVLSSALLPAQAVPALLSYQGRVVDGAGAGLGTGTPMNRKIIFRIFDAGTGGNRLWSEEQTVTLSNGDFSVILGQGISASYSGSPESPRPSLQTVFGGTDRYLEIVVDNGDGILNATDTPIAPRQRLISTAYALRAATADAVASGSDLVLRDANHGLGWYGTGRPFNGVSPDGPVLYGFSGGMLGTVNGATQSTALRWDSLGRVSIGGGGVPTEKLDVQGNIKASGSISASGTSGFVFNSPAEADGGLFSPGDGIVTLKTNGSERLRVDASGNLGLGTLTSAHRLDVSGSIRINNGGLGAPTNSETGGTGSRLILWPGNATDTPFGFGMDGSTLWSSVPTSASFNWYGGTTSRMTLSGANGNLNVTGSVTAAGVRMKSGFDITDENYGGGAAGNYITFAHAGASEDFIGYRNNTFYFKDSPGGGDAAEPNVVVGGQLKVGSLQINNKNLIDVVYPVGVFYVQYPDALSDVDLTAFPIAQRPAMLFPGTIWTEQFTSEGVFFRTAGGNASESRSSGLQEFALKRMTGYTSWFQTDYDFRGTGNTGVFSSVETRGGGTDDGGGRDSTGRTYFDSGLQVNPSNTEVRPKNRLMKIWKRIQ